MAWREVWTTATAAATDLVVAEVERRLQDAAAVSRFPRRRVASLLPTAEEREMIAARFSAAGTGLERATELEGADLRRRAGELEGAWEWLTAAAGRELSSRDQRVLEIRSWRRPWRPLVIGGIATGMLALWVGLILGGYLPVPALVQPVVEWYWGLSWP